MRESIHEAHNSDELLAGNVYLTRRREAFTEQIWIFMLAANAGWLQSCNNTKENMLVCCRIFPESLLFTIIIMKRLLFSRLETDPFDIFRFFYSSIIKELYANDVAIIKSIAVT